MSNKKRCSAVKQKALSFDQFGHRVNWRLTEGAESLNTITGFVTSIIIVSIILFYAAMQLQRLMNNGETLVTLSMRDSYFNDDFVMSTEEHGLQFAFALTAYDNKVEFVDESEYGYVSAKYATWGLDGHSYSDTNVPIHHCSPEELGLGIADGDEHNQTAFFKTHKNS